MNDHLLAKDCVAYTAPGKRVPMIPEKRDAHSIPCTTGPRRPNPAARILSSSPFTPHPPHDIQAAAFTRLLFHLYILHCLPSGIVCHPPLSAPCKLRVMPKLFHL